MNIQILCIILINIKIENFFLVKKYIRLLKNNYINNRFLQKNLI